MRTFYEEFRIYYLPWLVAASAIAIILWQQHTTIQLIERINGGYLDRLATVSESLERVNVTLQTEGYTLPPLAGVAWPDVAARLARPAREPPGRGCTRRRPSRASTTRGTRDVAVCQGRSKIRPPWRRKTRPSGRGVAWLKAAVRRRGQDAGAAAGGRAFLLCSRR